jgi:hypothetical protein
VRIAGCFIIPSAFARINEFSPRFSEDSRMFHNSQRFC